MNMTPTLPFDFVQGTTDQSMEGANHTNEHLRSHEHQNVGNFRRRWNFVSDQILNYGKGENNLNVEIIFRQI